MPEQAFTERLRTGHSQWWVSVTLRVPETACARQRNDNQQIGVDFGVEHWANFDDGTTIDNPRWVRNAKQRLGDLHRQRAGKRKGSHRATGNSVIAFGVCIERSLISVETSCTSTPR